MSTDSQFENRALALSALTQASDQVSKIARTGMHSQDAFETSIGSLFVFDAPTSEAIFLSMRNLLSGLRVTFDLLHEQRHLTRSEAQLDVLRYNLILLNLERQISRRPELRSHLRQRLVGIEPQVHQLGLLDPLVLEKLATLYREVTGRIAAPIQVKGEKSHLSNELNVNKIRALLLAGIRAAVLFHQLGGRRWQLLFQRTRLATATKNILNTI